MLSYRPAWCGAVAGVCVTDCRFTLVGDGIENPHNAMALVQIAAVLASACSFLDRKGLQTGFQAAYPEAGPLSWLDLQALGESYRPIIACDTLPIAMNIFGCRPAPGPRPALVVGNERLGLTHAIQTLAHQHVCVPMAGRGIDSLNVAAAAAVVLYYLQCGSGAMQVRADPAAHRPDLLLLGPTDHAELGCAIRSAAALGWRQVLVEDRASIWFGVDRRPRAEGRAAARQSKSSILIHPVQAERRYAYAEAVVITTSPMPGSIPVHRAHLARGEHQLIVVPDPALCASQTEDWLRLARSVRWVDLGLAHHVRPLRYRALASIAMAEVARQVGRASPGTPPAPVHRPRYRRELALISAIAGGEVVPFDDLLVY
jgi:hypothetical protein